MHTRIAVVIERWLDAPEMRLESLQATSQFGEEFEQACKDTPLNGVAIRNQWIPFRHVCLKMTTYFSEGLRGSSGRIQHSFWPICTSLAVRRVIWSKHRKIFQDVC
jgi:hypothetical protein